MFAKLLRTRPAAVRSSNVNATSPITSQSRLRRAALVSELPNEPAWSAALISVRAACHAGQSPNKRVVSVASKKVNAITRQSKPASSNRGAPAGANATRASRPQIAKTRPSPPPIAEIAKLSMSNCRMIWPREAPIAARTANSRARAAPRTARRFAKFAQAMSKTSATAPSSNARLVR